MKKLVLGLALCMAVNVAQAAPHGGPSLSNIFDKIGTKLQEIKNNISHNISHGGGGGGNGGGVCR
ncbi:MAG TPA: hypothetical protein PLZ79_05940 [Burkholderiales bacterium]|nr:hypothetical protein [Betaproteobacteria bacterium]HQR52791.1 hypothetical protein [Burkholderiales bacterium]